MQDGSDGSHRVAQASVDLCLSASNGVVVRMCVGFDEKSVGRESGDEFDECGIGMSEA